VVGSVAAQTHSDTHATQERECSARRPHIRTGRFSSVATTLDDTRTIRAQRTAGLAGHHYRVTDYNEVGREKIRETATPYKTPIRRTGARTPPRAWATTA